MLRFALFLSFLAFASRLPAQLPLSAEAQRDFGSVFEESGHKSTLDCRIETFKPFFDFSFRYEIGYLIHCPLKQFEGKQTNAGSILRVRTKSGRPTVLGQAFTIAGIPREGRDRVNLHKLRAFVEFSGVFVAGAGEYEVDLAVMDERGRVCRKSWKAEASAHGNESQAAPAMQPGTVGAVSMPNWSGISRDGRGLHLTVLLDAAPMNPYSRRLRAWDQAFLLGSLSSLLRGLPLASVRLVAFNLDQQREIFRDEAFDRPGMHTLARALDKLELGTVHYAILKRERGWAELLSSLVETEFHRPHPSDAVVFIGPYERFDGSLDPYAQNQDEVPSGIPVFYLKYFPQFGADFPDAIQRLTSARKGTTFKLHSPGDLAQALAGLQKQLQAGKGGG